MKRHSRWAAWEGEVLSKVDHPDACLDAIIERRELVDVEEEEGGIIEDFFARGSHGWATCRIRRTFSFQATSFPNGKRSDRGDEACHQRNQDSRPAPQQKKIHRLMPGRNNERTERGARWIGEHCDSDTPPDDYGVRKRMAEKNHPAGKNAGRKKRRREGILDGPDTSSIHRTLCGH